MKKAIILFVSFFAFACVGAEAMITVNDNGKMSKYPAGSVVKIHSSRNLYIEYNGVTIFIPKDTNVILREEMVSGERTLMFRGEDISGIKIGDLNISAKGGVAFSFSPSAKSVEVLSGALVIKNKKGEPALYYAGETYQPGYASSEDNSGETPAKVQGKIVTSVQNRGSSAYEQASKNIQEEEVLSKSSPR